MLNKLGYLLITMLTCKYLRSSMSGEYHTRNITLFLEREHMSRRRIRIFVNLISKQQSVKSFGDVLFLSGYLLSGVGIPVVESLILVPPVPPNCPSPTGLVSTASSLTAVDACSIGIRAGSDFTSRRFRMKMPDFYIKTKIDQ